MVPFLPELRGMVSRLRLLATFPLDVVDDPSSIEAAMQGDGNAARLSGHELSPLGHQLQSFVLFAGFGLDDRDLSDRLIVRLRVHG